MKRAGTLAAIFSGVFLLQILIAALVYHSLPNWETRGQFGDTFGVVNALFSGLAFAGLVYTILLQRKELQLQRRELRMTRTELKRSARAQELSEEALRAQASAAHVSSRLATVSFLLQRYSETYDGLRRANYPDGSAGATWRDDMKQKIDALHAVLDDLYTKVVDTEE